MLDRVKYLATFIYEILTACLKIIDPLLGLACLYTKKKIYLQLFLGLKTFLISSQLIGTTYLYTIRLNFEQLTNTRYEACYYKLGNDAECTEAWQSLQDTYEECNNATTIIESARVPRYLYFLQKQQKQQIRLWQLIESLPLLVKNTDEIIDNTTINGTTANVLNWWNSRANTTQTIYDEYLKNTSVVTSSELDRLIRLVPANLQNISSIINSTTMAGEESTTTVTTAITIMTAGPELSTDITSFIAETLAEQTSWNEVRISSTSQYSASVTASISTDLQSPLINSQVSTTSLANPASTDDLNIPNTSDLETSMAPTMITDSIQSSPATSTSPATATDTSPATAIGTSPATSTSPAIAIVTSPATATGTSPSSEEPYSSVYPIAFFRILQLQEVVRQQSPIQYTTNVFQWWNPFKQLLLNIEKEYQKMIAIRSLPPSPPPECQQDLYHMRYIATDLTVSVVIYSLNMITDVAGFVSMYKLSSALMKLTDVKNVERF